jgi:hypothetical protein
VDSFLKRRNSFVNGSIETLDSIGQWGVETFGGRAVPSAVAVKMLGEAVELCFAAGLVATEVASAVQDAFRKMEAKGQTPSGKLDLVHFHEELADCVIVGCTGLATTGGDPEGVASGKMAVNRARRWNVRPDGTAQHVPGGAS